MHKQHDRAWALGLCLVAVAMMSFTFAAQRAALCDFVSINGDFQSYNVFRRMLAGQTPYVEFTNYIGMAPVAVNLPLVALSNTFHTSLFVTTFTSCVIFCTGMLLLFWLITGHLGVSCLAAALLAKVVSAQVLYRLLGPRYGYIVTERFKGLFTPSNSMRGTRSFLPFLLVLLAMAVAWAYQKRTGRPLDYLRCFARGRAVAAAGLVTGLFVVWSNDYGLGTLAAALVLLVVLQLAVYRAPARQSLGHIGLFLLAALAGFGCSAALVTGGHPGAYLREMAQTAQYQYFYFNGTEGKAVLPYLFTTGILWAYVGLCAAFLLWALVRLLRGRADNRLFYLVFIVLSVVASTFVYLVGGSGYNCREPLECLVWLGLLALAARGLLWLLRRWQKPVQAVTLGLLVCLAGYYSVQAVAFKVPEQGSYIPAFGGRSTLTEALEVFPAQVGEEPVFSTYATGLEAVTGQFQPSGTDYIIHVLGEAKQAAYAAAFLEGAYPYVHTSALPVEEWVANQNWYFYRLLLPRYEQLAKSEYGWLWQRCGSRALDVPVECRLEQVDPQTVKVVCTSPEQGEFVADVRICYDTRFASPWSGFCSLGRRAVIAAGTCVAGGSNVGAALPGSGTQYIPVKLTGGRGETLLTGAYGPGIDLTVTSAEAVQALPPLDYQHIA